MKLGFSLRGLFRLVDKALLRRDPDTGRYATHELVRQYAAVQPAELAEAERATYLAHATYFVDFMQTREAHLHERRQKGALREISADVDNIRAGWNYWTDKQDAARITGFLSALWLRFEVRAMAGRPAMLPARTGRSNPGVGRLASTRNSY